MLTKQKSMTNGIQKMLTSEQSLSVFYQMLRFRLIEEEIAKKYSEQEMRCPVHLSIGQEAAEIASAMALEPEDYVMSGHRAHGHYLGKGGSLKAMIAELYGKKTGCAGGYGGSMHLIDKKGGLFGVSTNCWEHNCDSGRSGDELITDG